MKVLQAQLLCDYIARCHWLSPSLTHKPLGCSTISPLFEDRFARSFRFFHQEFEKDVISDGCRSEIPDISGRLWILSDFSELNFCGPSWPCFVNHLFVTYLDIKREIICFQVLTRNWNCEMNHIWSLPVIKCVKLCP